LSCEIIRVVGRRHENSYQSPVLGSEEPVNILIVDDEPKNLTVLEAILDDPGYRLVRAESAEQALLALLVDQFALAILDIRMPGTTGLELAEMMKTRRKTANVPIIFATAYYNEEEDVIRGYEMGGVDYVRKPVNSAILRSKVAIFAEFHRERRNLEQVKGYARGVG
jgi:DNA-binding response OmpR family regulator